MWSPAWAGPLWGQGEVVWGGTVCQVEWETHSGPRDPAPSFLGTPSPSKREYLPAPSPRSGVGCRENETAARSCPT